MMAMPVGVPMAGGAAAAAPAAAPAPAEASHHLFIHAVCTKLTVMTGGEARGEDGVHAEAGEIRRRRESQGHPRDQEHSAQCQSGGGTPAASQSTILATTDLFCFPAGQEIRRVRAQGDQGEGAEGGGREDQEGPGGGRRHCAHGVVGSPLDTPHNDQRRFVTI